MPLVAKEVVNVSNLEQELENKLIVIEEENMGIALRGLFIIDKEGVIQHSTINNLAIGRSVDETMRTLQISKDGEVERLSTEVTELHKSKRRFFRTVERKDSEISEKNATIKTYLDKIVNVTDDSASKQAHLRDTESEMARSNATCARLLQEKELIQRHNLWLNEELTVKVSETIELRRRHAEVEEDLSNKLADVERQFNECSRSLRWNKERVKELEEKLTSLQEELCSSKETNGENEARFSAEISTVTKLVEYNKESSEEWSRKAGELEGVIKALEMHLSQLESDYKEKLQKEESARKMHEKACNFIWVLFLCLDFN
ncbi:hypothetical protein IFM89_008380 [Coptis chinensis]|uniref:Nucleoprotein TPR/MPL1 domain-containing protein n=1 Tax=Coptis chinensis TaxID=261450 RepID=A0A835M4V2_9MAGN|nr:hypothetical protein IFM89_008380 [Coptis chinensis]